MFNFEDVKGIGDSLKNLAGDFQVIVSSLDRLVTYLFQKLRFF